MLKALLVKGESMIDNNIEQKIRLEKLNQTARKELAILVNDKNIVGIEKLDKTEKETDIAHYEVGSKIRDTIKELGGIMPEELSTPKKSLKELEREKSKMSKTKF